MTNEYEIGTPVFTTSGKGIIRAAEDKPYDGICYQIELENGQTIWRKEKYIAAADDELSKIAIDIAKKFNLNIIEVKKVIEKSQEKYGGTK